MDFRSFIREATGRGKAALEIGPSYNPILPRSQGFRVTIMDHASGDELRQKYRQFGVDISSIEEVDIIGTDLGVLARQGLKFDVIVASHLIEHTTDIIRFLQACRDCLSEEGQLMLIVPDKRYCFDMFRPLTTAGAAIDAFVADRKLHRGAVFDHYAYFARNRGQMVWPPSEAAHPEIEFIHSSEITRSAFRSAIATDEYTDAHEWVFTPSSFRLLLRDLADAEFIDLGEAGFYTASTYEFLAVLDRKAPPPQISRPALLEQVDLELSAVSPTAAALRGRITALESRLAALGLNDGNSKALSACNQATPRARSSKHIARALKTLKSIWRGIGPPSG